MSPSGSLAHQCMHNVYCQLQHCSHMPAPARWCDRRLLRTMARCTHTSCSCALAWMHHCRYQSFHVMHGGASRTVRMRRTWGWGQANLSDSSGAAAVCHAGRPQVLSVMHAGLRPLTSLTPPPTAGLITHAPPRVNKTGTKLLSEGGNLTAARVRPLLAAAAAAAATPHAQQAAAFCCNHCWIHRCC